MDYCQYSTRQGKPWSEVSILIGPDGKPASFMGTERLQLNVWAGQDGPRYAVGPNAATWLDPDAGKVLMGLSEDETAALPVGSVSCSVEIQDDITGEWYPGVAEFKLVVEPARGSEFPEQPHGYCQYGDLLTVGAAFLASDGRFSEAGCRVHRGQARLWLDAIIISRVGGDPLRVSEALATGGLSITPGVIRATAYKSLSLLAEGYATPGEKGAELRAAAADYARKADREALCLNAYVTGYGYVPLNQQRLGGRCGYAY